MTGVKPMKLRDKKKASAAMALIALVTFQAGSARADDTAAEIRLLKARLKQLEQKVAHQDKQIRGAAKFPAMPPAPETPIVCKDAPCPPPPPPVFVSFTNGLKGESWDHDFSFKIGGRIFVDGGVSTQPVQAFAGRLRFFPAHAASGFSNQLGFRQARLQVEGTAFKDWEYKFQYDFVGSPNDLIVGGIRDAYVAWRYFVPFTFEVGNFFEPNSLERSVSSAKYRDFIERSQAGDLLAGNRHIGIAAVTGGEAPGILGKSNWSAKAGIFSTSLEDGAPVGPTTAGAVVTNVGIPAGSSSFLNPVPGGHQYWDAAGRLTYAPIVTEDSLLHIGGSVRYQNPNDATAASDDRVLQPGGTLKSSANILNENLLGTQPLTCVAATAQLVGQNCVKDVLGYGAELVGSYGPFSVQAEYLGMHYDRDAGLLTPQAALIELLARVGARNGAAVFVSAEELSEWPAAAVAAMKSQKLLAKARTAVSVVCPGCERGCVMPVHTVPAGRSPVAFIVCDNRSHINRVAVSAERQKQWRCDADAVCGFIAASLGLRRSN